MAAASNHQYRCGHYVCHNCNKSFQLQLMYACYHGHYLCRQCYDQIQKDSQYSDSKLIPSDEDDVAQCPFIPPAKSLHALPKYKEMGEHLQRQRAMFPNPSSLTQQTIDMHNSLISLASICKPSLLNLVQASKKPIVCPQYDCRKTIAVSALDLHFRHEHEQVATILTTIETRHGLDFNFRHIQGKCENMCLVLINLVGRQVEGLPDDHQEFLLRQSYGPASFPRPKPFFILIAAKMLPLEEDQLDARCPDFGYQLQDRVFFYLTSNVITNYSYTIAASTQDQRVRIKYFGPLLSVNDDCRKLCDEGKGLVMGHHHIVGMTETGARSINLDLIIHEREDQATNLIGE